MNEEIEKLSPKQLLSEPILQNKSLNWTKKEDEILLEEAKKNNYRKWKAVAKLIPGKSAIQCASRYNRIKPGINKGQWTNAEDKQLLKFHKIYGNSWSEIAKKMQNRTGKQIRDRFLNNFEKSVKKGKFLAQEDKLIIKWHKIYGNSWSKIAEKIEGRTGDMVKNRFYSSLKNYDIKNNDENNDFEKSNNIYEDIIEKNRNLIELEESDDNSENENELLKKLNYDLRNGEIKKIQIVKEQSFCLIATEMYSGCNEINGNKTPIFVNNYIFNNSNIDLSNGIDVYIYKNLSD